MRPSHRSVGFVALLTFTLWGGYACVSDSTDGGVSAPDGAAPDASAGGDSGASTSNDGSMPATDSSVGTDSGCNGAHLQVCGSTCTDTSQTSTDCGRCGHDCAGTKCVGSVCQSALLNDQMDSGAPITALTTDQGDDNPASTASHVFWGSSGGVFQDNAAGGNIVKLSKGSANPTAITVHQATVYWVAPYIGVGQQIGTANVSSAASEAAYATMTGTTHALFYDATDFLLVGSFNLSTNYGTYTCSGAPVKCAGVTSFAGTAGLDMATDGTHVYVPDSASTIILAATYNGQIASGETIPMNASQPNLVRVQGTGSSAHLYWSNGGTPSIWRGDLVLSGTMQLATPSTAADGLAVDDVNVYWTEQATGTLSYAPVGGGGPTTTYVNLGASSQPMLLVRDKQFLYFTHETSIYRVVLP